MAAARDELERTRDQLRQQAHGWHRYSLIYGGVGFILIAGAVGALVFGFTTTGIITTVASVIPDAAAVLFFRQAKRADDRLAEFANSLSELRDFFAVVEVAQTVDNPQARDELKKYIVRKQLEKIHANSPRSKHTLPHHHPSSEDL
ncbi:MAG TPA: hypothetical protein VF006_17525 [Longimicrobium sp.]